MHKKILLRLLLALFLASCSSSAFALRLGPMELKSALNQPLEAEVPLLDTGGLSADQIIPGLASQEDFDRFGTLHDHHLADLKFDVRSQGRNQYVIQVTSDEKIVEPYLNFVVSVVWPTGQLLREYTLFFDAPTLGVEALERPVEPVQSRLQDFGTDADAFSGDETRVEIKEGDTLWSLASRVRPDKDVSVYQTMLALQRKNPDAFIGNNINRMRVGYILRAPDLYEVIAETKQGAFDEVERQSREFKRAPKRQLTQLDARKNVPASDPKPEAAVRGELRLLAGTQEAKNLAEELAVAREELDIVRRSISDLDKLVDDLKEENKTLDELIKLKDEQLAALQKELRTERRASRQTVPRELGPERDAEAWTNYVVSLFFNESIFDHPIFDQPIFDFEILEHPFFDHPIVNDPAVQNGLILFLLFLILMGLFKLIFRKSGNSDDFWADEKSSNSAGRKLSPQASEMIEDAEVHIAYGRFPQAIGLLLDLIATGDNQSAVERARRLLTGVPMDDAVSGGGESRPDTRPDDSLAGMDFNDDAASKLNLARAYVEMDEELNSARSLLKDVLDEGDEQQVNEAQALLARLG